MKKKLLIAGIIVLIGVVVFLISRFGGKQEQGVLTVSGNVEVTEVNMGFKTSGRVVELLVEEGQKGKRGDKLAVLDSGELQNQVAQHSIKGIRR